MVTVIGLVNSLGQCVSPPQVVYEGTPSIAGDPVIATWSALAVPTVGGTYKLRFKTYLDVAPALCLSQFSTSPPLTDTGTAQGLGATVVVPAVTRGHCGFNMPRVPRRFGQWTASAPAPSSKGASTVGPSARAGASLASGISLAMARRISCGNTPMGGWRSGCWMAPLSSSRPASVPHPPGPVGASAPGISTATDRPTSSSRTPRVRPPSGS